MNFKPQVQVAVPSEWSGDTLTAKIMRLWAPRAATMDHDYSLVGYLLSPNPAIMKHAATHKTQQHHDAVSALISKLLLPRDIVGEARVRTRAELVHQFWMEYSDFTLKMGKFDNPDMWVIAENPMQLAHLWHKTYSLPRTEVPGKLACLTTSKNLGIGSAERHWKIMKRAKTGQSARLSAESAKKQSLVYGAAMQQRARFRVKKLSDAGKLWRDEDFETLKLDHFCGEIVESARELPVTPARIFRAWEEGWEKKKVGPQGDDRLEARLVAKYGGLCWLDIDENYRRVETHPTKMFFEKKRGDNKYIIFATYEGFDLDKDPDDQKSLFDGYPKTQADFYEEVVGYYKNRSDVTCYLKDGECDSDSDFAEDD